MSTALIDRLAGLAGELTEAGERRQEAPRQQVRINSASHKRKTMSPVRALRFNYPAAAAAAAAAAAIDRAGRASKDANAAHGGAIEAQTNKQSCKTSGKSAGAMESAEAAPGKQQQQQQQQQHRDPKPKRPRGRPRYKFVLLCAMFNISM